MQLEAGGRIHVIRCKCRAAGVIEQHHARPVFLFIGRLRCAPEFCLLLGDMVVLDAHQVITVIAHGPELSDVINTEHIAVHEYGPSEIPAQPRYKKPRKRELRRLERISLTGKNALQTAKHDRRDTQRLRGPREEGYETGHGMPQARGCHNR